MAETLPDLNIDMDTLCYIIVKAKEFDVKVQEDNLDEGSDTADDDERDILVDFADDPTLSELREAIQDLNDDEQTVLVALTWVGRGDFDINEWDDALATAEERHQGETVDYLIGTPLLGSYLEEGLAAFGESCEETSKSHL